jgi:putative nucleotidyltransferase with HDIG domain
VRNGAELTSREQARIYDRIARARAFHSFVEALSQPVDSTEGAGLGLMILLQFLNRIGLGEEAFAIEARKGETVAALVIPTNKIQLEKISVLTEAIVRDVEALPHFPDTILELIRLTEDPHATLAQIGGRIATDPALTADLLKLVNSAYYALPRRVNNILQGVKIVGLKGLRNLLYTYGAQKILGEKFAEMKALWEHSYRTAFYSFMLARSFKPKADILDDVYVAGILHDLGQIIVSYLHPQAMEQVARFCRDKDISPQILERFSFGLNHADIGALIARKWNFPEQLVNGIKYHHEPLGTPLEYKDIVYCVYMGNALCGVERDLITFEQIERPVLHDFGIATEEQGLNILKKLQNAFARRTAS